MKKIIPIIISVVIVIGCVSCFILYRYTEVFGKKVLPLKVNSAVIYYTPGNRDIVNEKGESIIPTEEIKISDKSYKKVSNLIKGVKKSKSSVKCEDSIGTLVINKDYSIHISDCLGYVHKGKSKTSVSIPNNLYNYVYDMIDNRESNLFKEYNFEKISLHSDNSKIDVSDKDNIKTLKNALKYYALELTDDYATYNGGYKYRLKLDESVWIFLYDNGVGYISKADDEEFNKYFIFKDDLYGIVQDIYKVSTDAEKK